MIESVYWKNELLRVASDIKRRCRPARWTEKRAVLLEREIMLAMYSVRILIERHKLSDSTVSKAITLAAYPKKTTAKPVNLLNSHRAYDLYDFDTETTKTVSLTFLCNQVIHSYVIFPVRYATKGFSHLYVCSDYERNRYLYAVPVDTIVSLLREVGRDYPTEMSFHYDPKTQDYRITKSNAA